MRCQINHERKAANKSTYLKGRVQCFAEIFVANETSVLRINICGENCNFRLARNRRIDLFISKQ
jgi:hypothetical protein